MKMQTDGPALPSFDVHQLLESRSLTRASSGWQAMGTMWLDKLILCADTCTRMLYLAVYLVATKNSWIEGCHNEEGRIEGKNLLLTASDIESWHLSVRNFYRLSWKRYFSSYFYRNYHRHIIQFIIDIAYSPTFTFINWYWQLAIGRNIRNRGDFVRSIMPVTSIPSMKEDFVMCVVKFFLRRCMAHG